MFLHAAWAVVPAGQWVLDKGNAAVNRVSLLCAVRDWTLRDVINCIMLLL